MTDTQTYTVFSARAEMEKDVFGTVHSINVATQLQDKDGGLVRVLMDLGFLSPGFYCGEACVEFHFNKPKTLEWVRQRVREVSSIAALQEQGIEPHVLLQTLRPVPMAENDMERDYNLS